MAALPPALVAARDLLAEHGPMAAEELSARLRTTGMVLPAALLTREAQARDEFVLDGKGRIGFAGLSDPVGDQIEGRRFEEHDDLPAAEEEESPWWSSQPATTDLPSRWDNVVALAVGSSLAGTVALANVATGEVRAGLRGSAAVVLTPLERAVVTFGPVPRSRVAAALSLSDDDAEGLVLLDLQTLLLVADPTRDVEDIESALLALGLEPFSPADPAAEAEILTVLLHRIDTSSKAPSWRLALRLLAEDGMPWASLLDADEPDHSLEWALQPCRDPLAERDVAADRVAAPGGARARLAAEIERAETAREGFRFRAAQHTMAQLITDALDVGGRVAVEAPTGTGKSLGYLLPAVAADRPGSAVVVATHTKVLQRQLRTDAERLRADGVLAAPFRQIYGLSNYLCTRNIADAVQTRELPSGGWRAVAVAVRALGSAPAGVWDDLADGPLAADGAYRSARALLRTTSADCERRRCPWVDHCPLYLRLEGIERDPGIIATNHALVATVLGSNDNRGEVAQLLQRPATAIVFDEAHTLEDSLTSAWALQTSAEDLELLYASLWGRRGPIREAQRFARGTATLAKLRANRRAALQSVVELSSTVDRYLDAHAVRGKAPLLPALVRRRPEYGVLAEAAFTVADLLRGLGELLSALADDLDAEGSSGRSQRAAVRLRGRVLDVDAQRDAVWAMRTLAEDHRYLHLLEREGDDTEHSAGAPSTSSSDDGPAPWRFERLPIEVGAVFASKIAASRHTTVLTSATLGVGGTFDFIAGRLGIRIAADDSDVPLASNAAAPVRFTGVRLASPFDYERQALVVLTNHLPVPVGASETAFCRAAANDQIGFLSLTGGRTLSLFAARKRMTAVAELVRAAEVELAERGVKLLVQGDAPAGTIARRFCSDPGTVVYGLRSYWEGFDAPGETLSYLVLEKAPYPHPEDPLTAARQRAVLDAGGDPFLDYVLPSAAITFTQGFGRLIRTDTDRGAALVLDPRLQAPSSATRFLLDSLPTGQVVYASGRDDAWSQAIRFVTGCEPDLAAALRRDDHDLESVLRSLRLEPGEEPTRKLLEAARAFGIDELREEQLDVMRAMLAGRDVLGFFPTGWGKSICFQLPALLHPAGTATIVVSPLVALIKDQLDDLAGRRGLSRVVGLTGRTPAAERHVQLQRLAAGEVSLLYVSPERLVRDPVLQRAVAKLHPGGVVVDEAHCVSSWGFDFRPEFRQVAKAVAALPRTARVGLTATATPAIAEDLETSLDLRDPLILRRPTDRPDLRYWVLKVPDERARARELLRFVTHQGNIPGLVYASRRAVTEQVAWMLRQCGYRARAFHAGLRPDEKDSAQDEFLAGSTQIIVATKAFGMGINKADIGWVVHYDPPDGVDAYVQEAGRAAREVGLVGTCLMMYSGGDLARRDALLRRGSGSNDLGFAQRLLDRIDAAPSRNGDRLVDAEALADALEADEDTLNRVVAWLEDVGNLVRLPDAVARAHLTWAGREPTEPEDRRRFLDLVKFKLSARIGTRRFVEIDSAAAEWDVDPDRLEEELVDWSLGGWVALGVTQRRWRIRLLDRRLHAEALTGLAERWSRLQRQRFAELRRYLDSGTCRRAHISAAFGDRPHRCAAPAFEPCDVCDGGPPPWHAVPAATVPDPDQLVDVGLVALQTIRWSTRGAGRYGEKALKAALLGNETIGGRPLSAGLLRCPQFGAVRFVHGAERELERTLTRLVDDGLIERQRRDGRNGNYGVLELTERGRVTLGVGHG